MGGREEYLLAGQLFIKKIENGKKYVVNY